MKTSKRRSALTVISTPTVTLKSQKSSTESSPRRCPMSQNNLKGVKTVPRKINGARNVDATGRVRDMTYFPGNNRHLQLIHRSWLRCTTLMTPLNPLEEAAMLPFLILRNCKLQCAYKSLQLDDARANSGFRVMFFW